MPRLPSFRIKILAALLLTVAADWMLFDHAPGSVLGVLALAWLAVAAFVRRGWSGDPRGRTAGLCALLLCIILFDRPSFLAWALFGVALMVAMQSARVRSGEDVWRWGQRLVIQVFTALFRPLGDLRRLARIQSRQGRAGSLRRFVGLWALPLLGGAVFAGLFLLANPLLADWASRLRLVAPHENQIARVVFWGLCLSGIYGVLRPRFFRRLLPLPHIDAGGQVPTRSVVLSLAVFNLLFGLQNGLDLAILWQGAALPEGMTLAQYAHRGAYPLVFTALLAGLFVLVFLRPSSATARNAWVRRLVLLWVGQNLFLLGSSVLRTAAYVEAYGLTRFRIAALLWMGLVAAGLVLVCWRLMKDRSAPWLLNANALALGLVLMVVSAVDLGAVAADWNIRHARETGAKGAPLDLCYLAGLGAAPAVPLARLEQRTTDPVFKERLAGALAYQTAQLNTRQSDWRSWRWRDARRLSRVLYLKPDATAPRPLPYTPACHAEWID